MKELELDSLHADINIAIRKMGYLLGFDQDATEQKLINVKRLLATEMELE